MILVDKPYISPFLRHTLEDNQLPLVLTRAAREMGFQPSGTTLSEEQAVERVRRNPEIRILTSSENALGWVAEKLPFSSLPGTVDLFKNKVKFRRMLEPMYPDLHFRALTPEQALQLDPVQVGHPFVLKPAVGFFSLGVHLVNKPEDWSHVLPALRDQLARPTDLYPAEVLDSSTIILEEIISGTEFAIDAYFDSEGHPVVTNIFEHLFSSQDDVSDRVYLTGEKTIHENLARFTDFLAEVGRLSGLRNFPVHVEVRVNGEGHIVPIEVNPLRFGGWCTTADLTAMAYGFNPYLAYFRNWQPDWDRIFATRGERIYSIIVLDNSTGFPGGDISAFDMSRFAGRLGRVLDVRPVDHTRHPLFGFVFAEVPTRDLPELEWVLHSDLREFVELN